jgi:uncharacterized membrane protein
VSAPPEDLEIRHRWISISVVVLFSSAFALGLILYLLEPAAPAAMAAIHAGLLLLIASPAARMTVATAERIRRRDWLFLVMMLVIALELVVVLWRASLKG